MQSQDYVKSERRGSRGNHRRSRSRSRSRGRSGLGIGDSGDDYETLGSDTETEHGGVSSRTESSNQLDEITSLRDPSIIYSRSGKDHRRSSGVTGGGRTPSLHDGGDSVYGGAQVKRDGGNPIRDSSAALQQRIHHSKPFTINLLKLFRT